MSGLDLPTVPAARAASQRRLLAAGCALLAAVGAMVGSFLDLFTGEIRFDGETQLSMSVTAWGFDVDGGDTFGAVPMSGYPLMFATVLLFGAASTSALAAGAEATPGTTRGAAVVTVAGTAFLTGVVWSVGMELASFMSSFQPAGVTSGGITAEKFLGPGLWFLLVAVALAIAAAVLSLLRPRRTVPVVHQLSSYQADLPTPRHGFPIPVTLPGQPPPPPGSRLLAPFIPPPMIPVDDASAPPPAYPQPAPPVPSPASPPTDPSPADRPTVPDPPPVEPLAEPGASAGSEQASAPDRP